MQRDLICTKVQLDRFTELARRLNGKCGQWCPKNLLNKTRTSYLRRVTSAKNIACVPCEKLIRSGLKAHELYHQESLCPCHSGVPHDEVILALEEYIEYLQDKLNKEFSS